MTDAPWQPWADSGRPAPAELRSKLYIPYISGIR
jgi:hypothetical protein